MNFVELFLASVVSWKFSQPLFLSFPLVSSQLKQSVWNVQPFFSQIHGPPTFFFSPQEGALVRGTRPRTPNAEREKSAATGDGGVFVRTGAEPSGAGDVASAPLRRRRSRSDPIGADVDLLDDLKCGCAGKGGQSTQLPLLAPHHLGPCSCFFFFGIFGSSFSSGWA